MFANADTHVYVTIEKKLYLYSCARQRDRKISAYNIKMSYIYTTSKKEQKCFFFHNSSRRESC